MGLLRDDWINQQNKCNPTSQLVELVGLCITKAQVILKTTSQLVELVGLCMSFSSGNPYYHSSTCWVSGTYACAFAQVILKTTSQLVGLVGLMHELLLR